MTDHSGDDRSPERIEREIAETQANLSRTLSSLESRLAPSNWLDDITDVLRAGGGHRIADTIRDNPIPAALVAIGIAWLGIAMVSSNPQPDRFVPDARGWRRRAVLSAQSLIGDEVRNLENQMLGRIEDIMIDVPTGRGAHALLSFGGVMGVGNKLFPLPWGAFRGGERR